MEMTNESVTRLYWDGEMSIREVAEAFGRSEETVRRFMVANEIPRRDRTWRAAGWNRGVPMSDEQRQAISRKRREMYANGEIVHWNIGGSWSADVRNKISATLLGGRTAAPSHYGPDWQRQRTACLQRDGRMCQQCGATERLEVHHWEPFRFSLDNSLENLVTLCAPCHTGMHVRYRREGFIAAAEADFYA